MESHLVNCTCRSGKGKDQDVGGRSVDLPQPQPTSWRDIQTLDARFALRHHPSSVTISVTTEENYQGKWKCVPSRNQEAPADFLFPHPITSPTSSSPLLPDCSLYTLHIPFPGPGTGCSSAWVLFPALLSSLSSGWLRGHLLRESPSGSPCWNVPTPASSTPSSLLSTPYAA